MLRFAHVLTLLAIVVQSSHLFAADVAKIVLTSPLPYQVVQREGFEPTKSHDHHVGGAERGYADVEVRAKKPDGIDGEWEFKIVPLNDAFGMGSDWQPLTVEQTGDEFHGPAEVVAGGWYRLEARCKNGQKIVAQGSVEPFGVGEVFVVAGQSYAGSQSEESIAVAEPQRRVAAFNAKTRRWQVANDPQPNTGDGGSIWPALGDLLVPMLRVPVAFVNVSVSDSSSRKWLPDGELHKNMVSAGNAAGLFRCVLWQQGESDVIEKTPTDVYAKNLVKIRESAAREWKFEPTWLLAKSTLHPTYYNDALGEERIRQAIHQLWKRPHFAPGPDTDLVSGESRGDAASRRHFTGIGQRRAALLWFVAIWNEIEKVPR